VLSVARTTKANVPVAVGVPLKMPAELKARPGTAPATTAKLWAVPRQRQRLGVGLAEHRKGQPGRVANAGPTAVFPAGPVLKRAATSFELRARL